MELWSEVSFEALYCQLRNFQMNEILKFIPNHMKLLDGVNVAALKCLNI